MRTKEDEDEDKVVVGGVDESDKDNEAEGREDGPGREGAKKTG